MWLRIGACGVRARAAGASTSALVTPAEYDSIAGTYTTLFKWSQFAPWSIQAVVTESTLVSWGKILSPRVGLMLKDWSAPQAVLADFTQFSCGALGLWARGSTIYFPPANLLTFPLPRNVLYDLAVSTVSASGAASAAVVVQAIPSRPIMIPPQPPTFYPGSSAASNGLISWLDPTASYQQASRRVSARNLARGSHDTLCHAFFVQANVKMMQDRNANVNTYGEIRAANMPSLVLGQQFGASPSKAVRLVVVCCSTPAPCRSADRSAIVFVNNQWLEASQLGGWADFLYNSVTPSASLGITIMAVVQFNPTSATTHPFCKGARANSNPAFAGYCLEVAPNAASITWCVQEEALYNAASRRAL